MKPPLTSILPCVLLYRINGQHCIAGECSKLSTCCTVLMFIIFSSRFVLQSTDSDGDGVDNEEQH